MSRRRSNVAHGSRLHRVPVLGDPAVQSPLRRTSTRGDGQPSFVPDNLYVRDCVEVFDHQPVKDELLFEKAGPRERIFFDPARTKAAIVTCGGLCPGLNDVLRSVFLELYMNYGVRDVLGIRYGYQGLNPQVGVPPVLLSLENVEDIHREAGTVLGSSRGHQDPAVMVDFLVDQGINILFCVGGDGTQRGAHQIYAEANRRGLNIAVVGIPKTIDNDIAYCQQSFGLVTAVAESQKVLDCAHAEAKGVPYGIGLVKLMGREAGFITAIATLASQDVNFALVPELPFALEGEQGFLPVLRQRMLDRRHAVVVVAEGAGQDLFEQARRERDASGNIKFEDIGWFLKQNIVDYFAQHGPEVSVKYIDPSYIIRSVPANCEDSVLCDQFARHAVHAAMSGKTDVLIGHVSSEFVHVPIQLVSSEKRRMSLEGQLWSSVIAATGQPKQFV
jgi:6-phosphofructokinase 1